MFGRRSKTSTPEAEPVLAVPSDLEPSGFEPIPGAADEPCTPCEAARRARQFSLNAPAPAAPPVVPDDAVPTIPPHVTTEVGDDSVELSVSGQGPLYTLNATAGLIWLTIDGRLDVAGIIADLARETGAPADQIAPDIRSSLATFVGQGLVTLASST